MNFDEFLEIAKIGKKTETRRVYGVHLSAWRFFCEARGVDPLAPSPHTVADFLQTIKNTNTRASVRSILFTSFTALAIYTRDEADLTRLEAMKNFDLTDIV